jgi:hypothetical protein
VVAVSLKKKVPAGAPLYRTFSVGPDNYTFGVIDSLTGPLTAWAPPGASPLTVGLTDVSFMATPDKHFPSYVLTGSTAALAYTWNTGVPQHLIALEFDTTLPPLVRLPAGTILQTFVHGDGSSALFRFVLEDSVGATTPAFPGRIETSPWHVVDWVGWRLVEWPLESVPPDHWSGNGVLEGEVRFRGYHVGYNASLSAASGVMRFAKAQFADKLVTSIEEPGLPRSFSLSEPYPNPFNPSTSLVLELSVPARVKLAVYDVVGREVGVIMNGDAGPGRMAVTWDGRNPDGRAVASGVYMVRASIDAAGADGAVTIVRKLLLAK